MVSIHNLHKGYGISCIIISLKMMIRFAQHATFRTGNAPVFNWGCSSHRDVLFLLLDELINHFDIPSHARFEEALANFKGTILAVVHDRYFIERFASDVWTLKNGKIIK